MPPSTGSMRRGPVLRTDLPMESLPPPPRIYVRILRVAGWNISVVIAGLLLIAIAGEIYVRVTTPFERRFVRTRFVPDVGVIYEPGAEHRWTNYRDFWTISRSNSLGFLDREPISPERAAESCHVTIIGDSFVDAREVPISDKMGVQLEELAAQELPGLDVTTSAFAFHGTAQVNQLPFYDYYAQRLSPKLLVLVFVRNDFLGNSPVLAENRRWDPDHAPYAFLERAADGMIRLIPPDPRWEEFLFPSNKTWITRSLGFFRWSEFAAWLHRKMPPHIMWSGEHSRRSRIEALSLRLGYEYIVDGWDPSTSSAPTKMLDIMVGDDPPPVFREALEFVEFTLRQFLERIDRDGGSMVILSTHDMGDGDSRYSILLNEIAGRVGIPIISQHDYIIRQGGRTDDATFQHEWHWNATGHRWAAEALLEYLKENQEICE